MKNIKLYPKEWLKLHPYQQSTPADLYYTQIANRIYDILEKTHLAYSFEKKDVKQISLRMAAYFEDVISGLNIWRSFIMEHKALFGKYLPFYTPDDHYYDDEANYEDIRFLLWHYTQQYHGAVKGTFVSPDNATNGETASLIYQLFCDEWTTAPENEKMQALFSPDTRYDDPDKYIELLSWFYFRSYLFTDSGQQLSDIAKAYWKKGEDAGNRELLLTLHESLPQLAATPFLAYSSPKWLSLIMPADHPDHDLFVERGELAQSSISRTKVNEETQKKANEEFGKFTAAAEGKPLVYFQNEQESLDFLAGAGIEADRLPKADRYRFALYATPNEGLQVLGENIECIKDENNPFYDQNKAESQAISFFMIDICKPYLLRILEERGMLADAQAKSLISEERSKAIVHENWEFMMRYFLREY